MSCPSATDKMSPCREQLAELLDVEWLDEVVVESRGARLRAVRILVPSGEGNQERVGLARPGANLSGHLVSIHLRHPDVEKHGVEGHGIDLIQRGSTAMDHGDSRAEGFQKDAERFGGIAVVVDHEDALIGQAGMEHRVLVL
jgi:hypothetical protein